MLWTNHTLNPVSHQPIRMETAEEEEEEEGVGGKEAESRSGSCGSGFSSSSGFRFHRTTNL